MPPHLLIIRVFFKNSLSSSRYLPLCLALGLYSLYGCSNTPEAPKKDSINIARKLVIEQKYEEAIRTLRQVKPGKINSDEYNLMLGLSYYKSGNFLKSIEAFNSSNPESLEIKIYIAYLYLLSGNSKDAEKISDTLLAEYGDRPSIYILRGNIRLKEEKLPEALSFFRKALALDKTSVKAIIGHANAFFFQRDFVKAEEYYLKAVYLSDSPGTYISLSNFYKRLRRYEDAENNIKIALKTYPENKHLLLALLNIYLKRDNEVEAVTLIERLLAYFPHSTELKVRKIKTLLILNKYEEAYGVLEEVKGQFGRKTPYYLLLLEGEYHLRTGNLKQALSSFNNAFTQNSNSYETNYFLGLLNILRGNLRSARQYLEKSISIFPGYTRSHLLLSYIYVSEKKYPLAAEHCKIVLQLEPDNEAAHSLNGLTLSMMGLREEANYEFEVTRKINPENTFAAYMTLLDAGKRGDLRRLTMDKKEIAHHKVERLLLEFALNSARGPGSRLTRQEIQTYLNKAPNYLSYMLAGEYFEKSGDIDFATNLYEKSTRSKAASVISFYKLAKIRSNQGKRRDAIELLLRAIQLDEYFVKSYRALGSLYEEEEEFDLAKKTYTRGLALFPDDPALLNNMGWITLTHYNDRSSAYQYIREAVTLKPDDPYFMDTLAWWYFNNHDYLQAIEISKKAIGLAPKNPLFYYHLGFSYKEQGDMKLAKVNFKEALKLPIDGERKKEILKVLGR